MFLFLWNSTNNNDKAKVIWFSNQLKVKFINLNLLNFNLILQIIKLDEHNIAK